VLPEWILKCIETYEAWCSHRLHLKIQLLSIKCVCITSIDLLMLLEKQPSRIQSFHSGVAVDSVIQGYDAASVGNLSRCFEGT
jgi:hypothetical protein